MADAKAVEGTLVGRFSYLQEKTRVPRARRVFAEVALDKFSEVFDYAVKEMHFSILCTITGLDLGSSFGAIYHLANEDGVMLNLSTNVPKEKPVFQTVTKYFPAADAYEREMVDLLGVQVEGLAPGNRYPLPDGWPEGQYPLRKEWKAEMLSAKDAKPTEGKKDE